MCATAFYSNLHLKFQKLVQIPKGYVEKIESEIQHLRPGINIQLKLILRYKSKKNLSANLIEKKILSLKWAENNILLALRALKNVVFVEINNVATTCREKKFCCAAKRKKKFDSEKNHS